MKINKLKNKIVLIVIISLVIFCFSNPIFARYYETIEKITVRAIIDESVEIENKQAIENINESLIKAQ